MKYSDFPNLVFASSTVSYGNMTLLRGNKRQTLKNRKKFLDSLKILPKQGVGMDLVFSTVVKKVKDQDLGKGILDSKSALVCDGLMTDKENVFLFMLTGDCLPIAFFEAKNQVICLLHGSWINLDQDFIKNVVKKMQKNFQINPQELVVKIGPSIGPCCYNKIPQPKQLNDPKWQLFIKRNSDKKYSIDLWSYAKNQLIESGILKTNIENAKICTYHSNQYFSHRKYVNENLSLDARFTTVLGIRK